MIGFCSFEAHINSIAADFLVRQELTILDKSILSEREFRLADGEFVLADGLKMYRINERVEFLHRRFSGTPLDKSQAFWPQFKSALSLRNELTHPKQQAVLKEEAVAQALQSLLDVLDAIYRAVYKKPYPARKRGMSSKMTF
jgi:hypothetical protein